MKREDTEEILFAKEEEEHKEPKECGKPLRPNSVDSLRLVGAARYEFGFIVSHGMIGVVYVARDKKLLLKPPVCVKQMSLAKIKEKNLMDSIANELNVLGQVRHTKGCVVLLDLYSTPSSLAFVFPYYSRGDLFKCMRDFPGRRVPEPVAQKVFKQLVSTLSKLHKKGVMHRDVKPENILVDTDFEVVLTDFGFATTQAQLESAGFPRVGTLDFYPFEMLTPLPGSNCIRYDHRVDVWSLGVLLFEMLYGVTPFHHKDEAQIKFKIRCLDFAFPDEDHPEAMDLLSRVFVRPEARISLAQVKKHAFYRKKTPAVKAE